MTPSSRIHGADGEARARRRLAVNLLGYGLPAAVAFSALFAGHFTIGLFGPALFDLAVALCGVLAVGRAIKIWTTPCRSGG